MKTEDRVYTTAFQHSAFRPKHWPAMIHKDMGLSFDDVMLVPKKSVLASRKDADLTSRLAGYLNIDVPIIASPMTSVVNAEVATAMYESGGFSVIPRFNTPQEQADEFGRASVDHLTERHRFAGAAFGLNDEKRIETMYEAGCRVFVLDVAHAHSLHVENYLSSLHIPEDVYLIVGSIATAQAAKDFIDFGVHGLRVGIGPGAACTTREVTGFGVAQLSAIMEVSQTVRNWKADVTIIADGAIKSSGDIVKALAAGADTVMVGRLLAGVREAPFPGEYFGMASNRVNSHNAPEGAEGRVEDVGTVEEVMKKLAWGIRSGVSYAGVRSAQELRNVAEFAILSPGVHHESAIRI